MVIDNKEQLDLYTDWQRTVANIYNLGGIIQNNLNDFPNTPEQITEFKNLYEANLKLLAEIYEKVLKFVE